VVDHPQGQVDRLASDHGQVDAGQPGPPVGGERLWVRWRLGLHA
jgi:hypothetical protein